MNKKIERLNGATQDEAEELLLDCCGSREWARAMAESRPFERFSELESMAQEIWAGLGAEDWLEAFAAHPKIGSSKAAASQKERAAVWSRKEQGGTSAASDAVLSELEETNRLYEQKFGYIFIVCATGKSADEMLELARERLRNDPEEEIVNAAAEQSKITRIRLEKLFGEDRETTL